MNVETPQEDALKRITVLENRLAKENKSIIRKFGMYGGLIALILSIFIGLHTIYDKTILEKNRKIASDQAEIRNIVARITEINSNLIALGLQNDPVKTQLIVQNANVEKIALLERASSISQYLKHQIGFAASMLLSSESLFYGKNDNALFFADMAIELAETVGLKAEAIRFKARALFISSPNQDIQAGRKNFEKSIQLAKQTPNIQDKYPIYTTYIDWIIYEAMFGSCEIARQKYDEAKQEIKKLPIYNSTMLLKLLQESVASALLVQNKCSVF